MAKAISAGRSPASFCATSRALALAAVIMFGLALVPGFPTVVFLILGAAFGAGAYAIHRRTAKAETADETTALAASEQPAVSPAASIGEINAAQSASRIVVRLGIELGQVIPEPEFNRQATRIRRELFADLGVDVPAIGLHVDEALAPRHIRIDLEGAPS